MPKIMPQNLLGFQTHRDPVAIAFDERILRDQVHNFLSRQPTDQEWQKWNRPCLYRPFDLRRAYLHKDVTDRPRLDVTRHLFEENLAFNLVRQTRAATWGHALVSDKPTSAVFLEIKDGSSIFPLYLYTTPEETAGTLFSQPETTRKPNLSPAFTSALSEKLGLQFVQDGRGDLKSTFGPEDVFYYAYAVFHSPTYRMRYAEFLKIDFPRLPLINNKKLFAQLAAIGKELVDLHLLKSPKVDDFITTYPEPGDNRVEKVIYADGKIHINHDQYFGNLPNDVWSFKVGGYQVCEKWLKDRRGRQLSSEDIDRYQRIVVSLKETISLMSAIDKAIPEWPLR
jgi:predicted helicase